MNIYDQFLQHCSHLQQGELIHHDKFSLQEAMSAIEIMDSKMDCGIAKARVINSWQHCLEQESLPTKQLTPSQLLDVMDETFAAIVNWLEGDMLAQTVYTNMYMHCIGKIDYRPLRAFCEAINKVVNLIIHLVTVHRLFREEDFNIYNFGLPLSRMEVSVPKVLELLKCTDTELSKEQRQCSANHTQEADILSALIKRFGFVHAFLSFLSVIKDFLEDGGVAGSGGGGGGKQQLTLSTLKQLVHKHLDLCLKTITSLTATSNNTTTDSSADAVTATIGFEPYLNTALLPPAVTKVCVTLDKKRAFHYYEELIQRLRFVVKILSIGDGKPNLLRQLQFIMTYGHVGLQGKSCLLSRNVLCLLLFNPFSQTLLGSSSLARKDFYRVLLHHYFGDSGELWEHAEHLLQQSNHCDSHSNAKNLQRITDHMSSNVLHLYFIYGHNRSRQHHMIGAFINNIWAYYEEAINGDNIVMSDWRENSSKSKSGFEMPPTIQYWSAYLLQLLYKLMWDFIQCGFDLSLYSLHELPSLYYCACEMLFAPYENQLKEFRTHLRQSSTNTASAASVPRKGGGGKKTGGGGAAENSKKNSSSSIQPCVEDVDTSVLRVCIYYMLSRATMYALAAFYLDKKLTFPQLPFGSDELRFVSRFSPLLNTGIHDQHEVFTRYQSYWHQLTHPHSCCDHDHQPHSDDHANSHHSDPSEHALIHNLDEAVKMFDLVKKQLVQLGVKDVGLGKSPPSKISSSSTSLPDVMQYSNPFPEEERHHLLELTKVNFVVCNLLKNGHKRGESAKVLLEWPCIGATSTCLSFFPKFRFTA